MGWDRERRLKHTQAGQPTSASQTPRSGWVGAGSGGWAQGGPDPRWDSL